MRSQKRLFWALRPQFGLKIRGGGGGEERAPPLDPPLPFFLMTMG